MPFRTPTLLAALVAALALAVPAQAGAQGWRCSADALSLSVLGGPALSPVTVGGNDQECASATGSLPAPLPVPLDAAAVIASTTAAPTGPLAVGGVADLRVRSLPTLPVSLPPVTIPDSLGALSVPLPTILTLPLLPKSISVDIRPAVQALLPDRRLPSTDLLHVQGAVAYAAGSCDGGAPTLAGSSQVAGISVLGQDLGVTQVVDQTLSLIDTSSIDPSNIDLDLVAIPTVLGIPAATLRPIVEAALPAVLDTLPPIVVPATLAHVQVSPGEQTASDGVLTQRALHAQVSIAGVSIADLAIGSASVAAAGVDCSVAGDTIATQTILECTSRPVTLIDVLPQGGRVRFLGAADLRYIGNPVKIVFDATGKTVARATVQPDGSFHASAPLPRKGLRNSNRARYRAVIGDESSLNLKLDRRMVVDGMIAHDGIVTISGRVLGPLAKPRERIVVKRRLDCTHFERVASVKPDAGGFFSIDVPAPAGAAAAVYRLSTSVPKRAGSDRLFPTYTLPRAVNLL